jgi:Protein of unknown function (DUF4238)
VKDARWKPRSIEYLARLTDLYTAVENGEETDEVEKWLKTEFEDPAAVALRRLVNEETLTAPDWEALVRFAGMQAGRTVASYLRLAERTAGHGQALLENTLTRAVKRLERLHRKGRRLEAPPPRYPSFPVSVEPVPAPDGNGGYLRANFVIGRDLFLWQLREQLPGLLHVLLRRRWTIARPAPGSEWITSDDPFIALHYNGPHDYSFNGGWGPKNGDLMLPLSPKHALFSPVRSPELRPSFTCSREQTFDFIKFTAEHAHRWIFARAPVAKVQWFRSPFVDPITFQAEIAEMRDWHRSQMAARLGRAE